MQDVYVICIARTFGIDDSQALSNDAADCMVIGAYQPCAGFAFPAYLKIPHESVELRRTAEAIVARCNVPFLLIAPTGRWMRSDCIALLKSWNACFLALADAVDIDASGKWSVTAAAVQQLNTFRQAAIPQAENADRIAFFATPANAAWTDVQMKFVDGETMSIKVGDVAGTFLYSEIGMVDGRNKRPNKQWGLLRSFAKGYGIMIWKSPDADRRNQKRREYLARDLKLFFRIDGEPIVLTNDKKGWRTVFSIEPDV